MSNEKHVYAVSVGTETRYVEAESLAKARVVALHDVTVKRLTAGQALDLLRRGKEIMQTADDPVAGSQQPLGGLDEPSEA